MTEMRDRIAEVLASAEKRMHTNESLGKQKMLADALIEAFPWLREEHTLNRTMPIPTDSPISLWISQAFPNGMNDADTAKIQAIPEAVWREHGAVFQERWTTPWREA